MLADISLDFFFQFLLKKLTGQRSWDFVSIIT